MFRRVPHRMSIRVSAAESPARPSASRAALRGYVRREPPSPSQRARIRARPARAAATLVAEPQQQLGEAIRGLDLRAVADPLQQLQPRARDRVEHPPRPAGEHQPVLVAPHQQHRHRDPLELERPAQLGDQPVGGVEVVRHPGALAVVVGEAADHRRVDRVGRGERQLAVQPRHRRAQHERRAPAWAARPASAAPDRAAPGTAAGSSPGPPAPRRRLRPAGRRGARPAAGPRSRPASCPPPAPGSRSRPAA